MGLCMQYCMTNSKAASQVRHSKVMDLCDNQNLIDLLLRGKFRGYLDIVNKNDKLDNEATDQLNRPAITYIDFDWNIATISYFTLIRHSLEVCHCLVDVKSIHIIKNVLCDDEKLIHLSITTPLIIYGDCAQWTPVLKIAANLASHPFYYVERREVLIEKLKLFAKICRFFICHSNRVTELIQLLKDFLKPSNFSRLPILEDLVLLLIECEPESDIESATSLEVAYLVNTSGTSRHLANKTLALEHLSSKLIFVPPKSIVYNILDFQTEYKIDENDRILVCSPFSFDPSICDLFLGLSSFSHIFLMDNSSRNSPKNLARILTQFQISYLTITPSIWRRFSHCQLQQVIETCALRYLNFGGEMSLPISQLRPFLFKSNIRIYNLYGLSEMSVWQSLFSFNDNLSQLNQLIEQYKYKEIGEFYFISNLPIFGRPIKKTDVYLDKSGAIIVKSEERKCLIYNGTQWSYRSILSTQDLGKSVQLMDSSKSFIYYLRRDFQDDFVKLNGIKCYPFLIKLLILERFNSDSPGDFVVQECHVLPGHWHEWHNSVLDIVLSVVFIDKTTNQSEIQSQIYKYLSKELKLQFAFRFHFVDSNQNLLSDNGKLNYNQLSRQIDHSLKPVGNLITSQDQLKNLILLVISSILQVEYNNISTHTDQPLVNFGLESMTALQIAINLEQRLTTHEGKLEQGKLFELILCADINSISSFVWNMLEGSSTTISKKLPSTYSNPDYQSSTQAIPTKPCTIVSRNSQLSTFFQFSHQFSDTFVVEHKWSYYMEQCVDASPVIIVTNDKTLLIGASHSGLVCALDLSEDYTHQTRLLLWSVSVGDRVEASLAATSDGTLVFVADYSGTVHALQVCSGRTVWQYHADDMIKCTPTLLDSHQLLIYGSYDKNLYAVNQFSGQLKWKINVNDSAIFSSATPWLHSKEWHLLTATLDGIVAIIHVDSGSIRTKLALSKKPIFSTSVIYEQQAVIGLSESSIVSFSLPDLKKVWQMDMDRPVFSSPIVIDTARYGPLVIVGTHSATVEALHLRTGDQCWRWQAQAPIYGKVHYCHQLSVLAVVPTDGRLYLLAVDSGESRQLRVITSMGDEQQAGLSQVTPPTTDHYHLSAQVFSSPIFYRDHLFIGSRDNCLHSIQIRL